MRDSCLKGAKLAEARRKLAPLFSAVQVTKAPESIAKLAQEKKDHRSIPVFQFIPGQHKIATNGELLAAYVTAVGKITNETRLVDATFGMSRSSRENIQTLFTAIKLGKVRQATRQINELADVDVRDEDYKTPLIYAACLDIGDTSKHFTRMLIQRGSDVNATDKFGRTALMYACFKESRLDTLRILTRAPHCNPNICDKEGNCAVMHAAIAGNYPALRVLVNSAHLKSILDVNLVNNQNLSPIQYAFKLKNTKCCRILAKEGNAQTYRIRDKEALKRILSDDDPAFVKTARQHAKSTSNTFLLSSYPPNQSRHTEVIDLNSSLNVNSEDLFGGCERRDLPGHSRRKLSPIISRGNSSQEFPKTTLTKLPSISPQTRVNLIAHIEEKPI